MEPGSLKIYKASAGSGKTFTLVREYLEMLFRNPRPEAYRGILAMTFTNKATAEMKQRLVSELKILADGKTSHHAAYLLSLGIPGITSPALLQERAAKALYLILHDYSQFHITTIDSFLQRLGRAFARDAGLSAGYGIVLDENEVITEISAEIIRDLEAGSPVAEWLSELVSEESEKGGSWDISHAITRFFRKTWTERSLARQKEIIDNLSDLDKIRQLQRRLRNIKQAYEAHLKEIGTAAHNAATEHGLRLDEDFMYRGTAGTTFFLKLAAGQVDDPGVRFLQGMENPETWVKKDDPRRDLLLQVAAGILQPLAIQWKQLRETEYRNYMTASLVLENLYLLGIAGLFFSRIQEYRDENDILLISDVSLLLAGITGENDESFIFEKAGTYFRHFLLDEFQDTSRYQWLNIRPLVANGIAEGNGSMLVGDVKQAIYRFRNGDWNLLLEEVENDARILRKTQVSLTGNYRSTPQIVGFNNHIFDLLPSRFAMAFSEKSVQAGVEDISSVEQYAGVFAKAYENHAQQAQSMTDTKGYVRVAFVRKEKDEEVTVAEKIGGDMKTRIEDLFSRGFLPYDICILIRTHSEGQWVIEYLHDLEWQGRPVRFLSERSALAASSHAVQAVVSTLRYATDRFDRLALLNISVTMEGYLAHADEVDHISLMRGNSYPGFESFCDRLMLLPALQAAEEVIRYFRLDEREDESSFLEALRQLLITHASEHTTSITDFLEFWELRQEDCTVSIPVDEYSIRLMTINKSKGLEFPVVMFPFCNFDAANRPQHEPLLWVDSGRDDMSLPLMPVYQSAKLARSWLYHDYLEELSATYLDKLNLLYVAFTRPERELYVWAEDIDNDDRANVSKFLGLCIRDMQTEAAEDGKVFAWGEKSSGDMRHGEDAATTIERRVYEKSGASSVITIRERSSRFFLQMNAAKTEKIDYGVLVHNILSGIRTTEDVEPVLQRMLLAGEIRSEWLSGIREKVKNVLEHPLLARWFAPGVKVFNEKSILLPDGHELVPDRVSVIGDIACVLEYKTGEPLPGHLLQVRKYRRYLLEMGYTQVESRVVYISDHIETVEVE